MRRSTASAANAGAGPSRSSRGRTRRTRPASAVERVEITLVADAADGDDELGRRVVALDALAQPSHVNVDRAWLDVRVAAPDEVEDLEAVVDAVRVAHEELEQLELAQREVDTVPVEERLVGVEVDAQ